MSKKYVIEIKPEYLDSFKGVMLLGAKDSDLYADLISVENLEELNADYINEHFGSLQDDAYKRGLEDGKQTAVGAAELREKLEYQKGLEDAWEAARKIGHASQMKLKEMGFDFTDKDWCYNPSWYVVMNYTASEAIAKLKAYEKKQKADDKIEVGDEVRRKSALKNERGGIVTKEWENSYFIMWTDGSSGQWDKDRVVKTGRHFDIDKILEEMRE